MLYVILVIMPFTPFHLGLGGVAGGYTSSWFSFRAFCFANVLLDMEAIYRIPFGLYPIHDWLHTFIVGTFLPLLLWFPIGKPFCLFISRWWNKLAVGTFLEKVHIPSSISVFPATLALIFGGLSHVFLDSIMHSDIAPLRPFSYSNPFFMLISIRSLHWILTAGGILGISLVLYRCRNKTDLG